MTPLIQIFLLISIASNSMNATEQISAAAVAHFDSLMAGRAISWTIEVKRIPQIEGKEVRIVGVEDREMKRTPRGSSICWVNVVVDGRSRRIPVTLTINPVELVAVARYDIKRRTELADTLIEWVERPTGTLGSSRLPSEDDIKNYWSKTAIGSGSIITMNRLELTPMVKAGTEVTLVGRRGVVEIKTYGKALEDALMGERVKVVNKSSGKQLNGTVQPDGLVLVE